MFSALQNEITDRFRQIKDHFELSPRSLSLADVAAQTTKGLVFVEVYAVYEYTVRTATRQSISEIAAQGHKFKTLKPSLLALYLDSELRSLRDVSEKGIWEKRLALLEKVFSGDRVSVVAAVPHDGNYYRHTQLQMTFDVLGIKRSITVRRRHKYTIDNVVDNRNRIAHGEETPAQVGRGYTQSEIKSIIRVMQAICTRTVTLMSEHCITPHKHRR